MSKKLSKSPGGGGSADIRSFFRPKTSSQPSSSSKNKADDFDKSTKRKAIVLSDSDDDTSKKLTNGTQKSSSPKPKVIKISTSSLSSKKKTDKPAIDLFADDSEKSKNTKHDEKPVTSKSSKGSSSSPKSSKVTPSSPSKSSSKTNGTQVSSSSSPGKNDKSSGSKSQSSPSKSPSKKREAEKPVDIKSEKEESRKREKEKSSPDDSSKRSKTSRKDTSSSSTMDKDTTKQKSKVKKEKLSDDDDDDFDFKRPSSSKSTSPKKSKAKRIIDDDEDEEESPQKKKKKTTIKQEKKSAYDDSFDSKSHSDPDEKRQKSREGYFKFITRGPPKELGTKDLPEGTPNSLADYTFVISGVLPAFERADIEGKITELGGRVTSAVSGKTDYLLVGDEAGESKTKKARQLKVKILSQDEFLQLLENPPPSKVKKEDSKSKKKSTTSKDTTMDSSTSSAHKSSRRSTRDDTDDDESTPKKKAKDDKKQTSSPKKGSSSSSATPLVSKSPVKTSKSSTATTSTTTTSTKTSPVKSASSSSSSAATTAAASSSDILMWVDKYKPTTLKSIVGQQQEGSNAKKLLRWLTNWFNYHGSATDKAKAGYPGLKDPEGKTFKVALLSGPPGVGKTTTAHLVCKELGYDFTELNASDKRNKKSFVEHVQDQLSNFECMSYFSSGNNGNKAKMNRKHVLIMDEVDGMSGNEDRGGIQELIHLLKSSRIPIICICNDRNHPKIRSLANYCFDLRFSKPTNIQLKSFVQQICFKEKIKVPPEVQQQLIISTDQDVRQTLHQLQMVKEIQSKGDTYSICNPKKDLRLGPWDVARKVFQASDHQNKSINDKASLFFHDYNIAPLFVQENYLRCVPMAAKGNRYKTMDLIKAAAESLAIGDVTESIVRKSNNWGLLPVQAIFQSVLPGEYMETQSMGGLDFPRWLGKNSNRNKRLRLLQQVHSHVHLNVSGSLEALNMDYLPYLRRAIVNSLVKQEVDSAVNYMTSYSLLREDLDNISELALWPNMRDQFDKLDTKTKTAFTRQVNKELFVPYSVVKVVTKRGKGGGGGAGGEDEELEGLDDAAEEEEEGAAGSAEEEEEEEEDLEKDAMIKVKKPRAKAGESSKASTSKGKTATESKGKRGKK